MGKEKLKPVEKDGMYELIYGSLSIQVIIEKEFPDAIFEDASDCIHPERFSVTFSDGSEEFENRFYVFAGINGFLSSCLSFQLLLRSSYLSTEQINRIKKVHKEISERIENG